MAQKRIPVEESERRLEKVLKALANARRLAILRYIKKRKEATVGTIAEGMKLSVKATSKHLGILMGAHILKKEQRNIFVYYMLAEIDKAPTKHIVDLL